MNHSTAAIPNSGPIVDWVSRIRHDKNRLAASLMELTAVFVVTGILAVLGVPQVLENSERSKAANAFEYLRSVQVAQESYHQTHGTYATELADLDPVHCTPAYFAVPTSMQASAASWNLQLTRAGANARWGSYTVSFNQNGFDANPGRSNIPDAIHPGDA